MNEKEKAVLMGPFVGELYWEAGRFAPMLPYMKNKQFKGKNIKFIVLTRPERFDLYGKFADILVPLQIENDYVTRKPECFRLMGLGNGEYQKTAKIFKDKYKDRFHIVDHIYPKITKPAFTNKNQFPKSNMQFVYRPRQQNYDLVDAYLPTDKPLVVLGSRFRKGFKRNWSYWPEFYDMLFNQKDLMNDFNFIICGKKGEYMPDEHHRFLDMNDIEVGDKSSLVGLLLVILERAFFTFGSQSAIPNLSLLYNVDVLEFGCQKSLHTKTYNITKTPITFIENRKYDLAPKVVIKNLRRLLKEKKEKIRNG